MGLPLLRGEGSPAILPVSQCNIQAQICGLQMEFKLGVMGQLRPTSSLYHSSRLKEHSAQILSVAPFLRCLHQAPPQ